MVRKAWAGWAAAALLGVGAAPPAPAETFKMVTGPNYEPFAGKDLPGGGIAPQMVRKAFAAQGHKADIVFRPWDRGYRRVLAGKYAATFPYFKTDVRLEEMNYSKLMFSVKELVVSNADTPVAYDGKLDVLTRNRICVAQAYDMPGKLGDLLDAGEIPMTARPRHLKACAKWVARGRADYVVLNNFVFPRILEETGLKREGFHVADTVLQRSRLYLIVAQNDPRGARALEIFNKGLAQLAEDGTLDKLLPADARE